MDNQNLLWTDKVFINLSSNKTFRAYIQNGVVFYPSLPWAAFLPPSNWRQFDPNSSPSDQSCPRRWSSTPAAWGQCPGSGREKEHSLDRVEKIFRWRTTCFGANWNYIWFWNQMHYSDSTLILNKQGIFSPQTFGALAIPHWRIWSPLHPCHSLVNPREKVVQVRLEI